MPIDLIQTDLKKHSVTFYTITKDGYLFSFIKLFTKSGFVFADFQPVILKAKALQDYQEFFVTLKHQKKIFNDMKVFLIDKLLIKGKDYGVKYLREELIKASPPNSFAALIKEAKKELEVLFQADIDFIQLHEAVDLTKNKIIQNQLNKNAITFLNQIVKNATILKTFQTLEKNALTILQKEYNITHLKSELKKNSVATFTDLSSAAKDELKILIKENSFFFEFQRALIQQHLETYFRQLVQNQNTLNQLKDLSKDELYIQGRKYDITALKKNLNKKDNIPVTFTNLSSQAQTQLREIVSQNTDFNEFKTALDKAHKKKTDDSTLSIGTIVGISIGAVLFVLFVLLAIFYQFVYKKKRSNTMQK